MNQSKINGFTKCPIDFGMDIAFDASIVDNHWQKNVTHVMENFIVIKIFIGKQ